MFKCPVFLIEYYVIQFFVVRLQIDQYIEHYQEWEWHRERYPHIILLINSSNLKKKVNEYIDSLIENGYIDEDELFIIATNFSGILSGLA